MPRPFHVKVPASLANIGPGFDVLGIGLNLYMEIDVKIDESVDTSSDPYNVKLSYEGDLAEKVPLQSDRNLVTQTALYIMRCNGINRFPNGTSVHVINPVPLGRGLGSSAAAIVGGIILGNEIGELNLSKERMLDYCLLIERHPDNIAAAMLGGFVGSYLNELSAEETEAKNVPMEYILPKESTPKDKIVSKAPPQKIAEYLQYDFNNKIKCITVIPKFELSTDSARAVLPEKYSRSDVVFNLQRIAILTSALGQKEPRPELIYEAMRDKVHQPYRSKLIPGLEKVLEKVTPQVFSTLCGICLSGAGPTILCLATGEYEKIAALVVEIFKDAGVECTWKLLDLAYEGATVEKV